MISIIDYDMGNLHSVQKALAWVGGEPQIIRDPEQVAAAQKLVLPGVGAFADAMESLRSRDLVEPIKEHIAAGRPFLGICLGLQLLFDVSYEDGQYSGLGVIGGQVCRFDFANQRQAQKLKIPHMGWNSLRIEKDVPIYSDVPDGSYVYFVHSYYVKPTDETVVATTTEHGQPFASSIARDNVFATQFHPEKSQRVGLQILKNFARL